MADYLFMADVYGGVCLMICKNDNSTNKESKKPDVVEGKRHRHQDRPQRKSTLNKEEETL
ncbi:hypothetical protein M514_14764 [Trichuris suis]|uniref:Uncharacterized protein n=1 Tax=Trichuris suis TaxID=68888 RepID=A0A085NTR4_9BILA|nr:hypothetical protein M514_14764 [Trichuris suis]